MADNPIKHSEIIQPGNPFNDTIKGLEKMIKLLKEAAKDYKKFAQSQNVSTKEGKKNIQAVANATQQLSVKEKEAIKIKKQLERQKAKLALMDTEEYRKTIKNTEAIRLKNAAIKKSTAATRQAAKASNTWGKALGSFAAKFNTIGNIAANVASKISQSINRALRDAGRILIDFDQAMADVKAITGASAKDFDKLSKSAKNLGGVTKFTASEVAKLQKEYAKLGLSTEQILGAQAATLDLASATNTELARAAEVVGITLKQFGLRAEEARRVTDVMSKSFSTSALDMEKFAEAMKMVGPAAKVSGMSVERTTAMLAQLADAGISGTMAGGALRNIMLGLAKESGTLTEKIAKVAEKGLDLAGASEEVQRRAATALLVLADGVDTIDDYTEALENAAGSTADMANVQLDTLRGQLTLVKSAWEGMILAMLDTEGNLSAIKMGLIGIIDVLTAIGIRAETGLKFSDSLAIAQVTRETAQWAIEMDRAKRSTDDLFNGFKNIGGLFKGFGKDLWNEMFPKESGDNVVKTLENIDELIRNLREEEQFTEEDQEAVISSLWGVPDEVVDKAKANLDKVRAEKDAELQKDVERARIATEARKKQEEADAEAEKEKQKKISATFELANRLTTSFTDLFESQKQRELSAAGDNAEKRAEIEKKYAKKQQILALGQAVVDGAQSLLKTKATLGLPAAIPFLIADAALTAVQIGVIAAQKFGEGEVDIHGPSHSRGGIAAEIEGGESVINKRSTTKYKTLLEAINANDSASIANAALQNEAFHDVWGRTNIREVTVKSGDPWTRKLYEAYIETPVVIPKGARTEYRPGRTRIYNG